MTHLKWSLLFAFFSLNGWSMADYSLIKDLVGTYPLIHYNGNAEAGGIVQIIADDSGVGFKLIPLAQSSFPVPAISTITEMDPTVLGRIDNGLKQIYESSDNNGIAVTIEYRFFDGYVEIVSENCLSKNCTQTTLSFTRGKASGLLIDTATFMAARRGAYKILKFGGVVPPGGDDGAFVGPDESKSDTEILTLPYCTDQFCDPGDLYFPYQFTQIFEGPHTQTQRTFTILLLKLGKLRRFTWTETDDGLIRVSNYQYKLPTTGEVIVLEHVMMKGKG